VLPDGAETPSSTSSSLARRVQRERRGERTWDVQGPDRLARGPADHPLALALRNDKEEVREPQELLLLRPARREPQVPAREGLDLAALA
jgi:hypothetical protein